ncbi:MAG: hypothetical protein NT005_02110 [Spirochaetes bacterium]|nr:hypothetical protein [Spirochaetota bacterium]
MTARATEKVVLLLDEIASVLTGAEFVNEEISADDAQELMAKAGSVTSLLGGTIADLLKAGGGFSLGEDGGLTAEEWAEMTAGAS